MTYSTLKVIARRRNEAKKLNMRGGLIALVGLALTIVMSFLEGAVSNFIFDCCLSMAIGVISIGLIGLIGGAGFQYLAEADYLATTSRKV